MSNTRNSKQRSAVLNELQSRCDHPSAEQIFIKLKSALPSLSLATVYRNLHLLESEGKVISFKENGTEHFDADLSEHYHLTCEKCGKIFDVHAKNKVTPADFEINFGGSINSFKVMFCGICAECATKAE